MNLDHYKNFIAIVECRSISAAAKSLHIAQPALSNQVKAFERLYGTPLLVRGTRAVELTDAGKIFYEAARNICRLDESAYKDIADGCMGKRGTLKIGITPSLPDDMLEGLFSAFAEKNPGISFDLYEGATTELIDLLKNSILEIAVIRTPPQIPAFLRVAATTKEFFYAYSNRNSPYLVNAAKPLSIQDLRDIPLSIPRGIHPLLTEYCTKAGFRPEYLSINTSRKATLLWAQLNHAVAILSGEMSSTMTDQRLIRFRIRDNRLMTQRSFVTLREKTLSPATKCFLETMRSMATDQ